LRKSAFVRGSSDSSIGCLRPVMEGTPASRARFGGFELDLRVGELHGNGEAVLLPQQVFQVLHVLLDRRGELVTRDELKKKLWPNDTVVEFEHGINNTIKRLRRALEDSAEDPRYIETIPRRGYRLMVPVESEVRVAAAVPRRRLGRWKIWLVGA